MNEMKYHLKCPWCENGETLSDGRGKVTVSVVCVKCKNTYLADLDTLKKRISTFGDFVAWFRIAVLDKLEFGYMESNERNQFVFGAEYAYSLLQYWFAPNMTVSIAQYVLEDDLPGIGRLFIIQKSDWVPYMRCANYIPVEDGYYIVNAELFSGADKDTLLQACNMDQPLFVKDLADLEPYLRETYPDNEPVQILAGIHRLLGKVEEIRSANVIVVIAGMEGALASVVGGLVDKPVIAVPTSVGYGANFNGLSALLGMLNSCSAGVAVVNIDNGFGAGRMASIINHLR